MKQCVVFGAMGCLCLLLSTDDDDDVSSSLLIGIRIVEKRAHCLFAPRPDDCEHDKRCSHTHAISIDKAFFVFAFGLGLA